MKVAGELKPAVVHVAARAVFGAGGSMFADHGDIMAIRNTGWAMLASRNVQEVRRAAF